MPCNIAWRGEIIRGNRSPDNIISCSPFIESLVQTNIQEEITYSPVKRIEIFTVEERLSALFKNLEVKESEIFLKCIFPYSKPSKGEKEFWKKQHEILRMIK
ncbi:MAG: hypothetical protein JSW73_02095 [Candidatus Woesearchaeota archaeon]|nr:MAG: hypothetical protein JSW73_02095 [Candidatus Woesearchaeota archaeon]